jgi:hypothetical protein
MKFFLSFSIVIGQGFQAAAALLFLKGIGAHEKTTGTEITVIDATLKNSFNCFMFVL